MTSNSVVPGSDQLLDELCLPVYPVPDFLHEEIDLDDLDFTLADFSTGIDLDGFDFCEKDEPKSKSHKSKSKRERPVSGEETGEEEPQAIKKSKGRAIGPGERVAGLAFDPTWAQQTAHPPRFCDGTAAYLTQHHMLKWVFARAGVCPHCVGSAASGSQSLLRLKRWKGHCVQFVPSAGWRAATQALSAYQPFLPLYELSSQTGLSIPMFPAAQFDDWSRLVAPKVEKTKKRFCKHVE